MTKLCQLEVKIRYTKTGKQFNTITGKFSLSLATLCHASTSKQLTENAKSAGLE